MSVKGDVIAVGVAGVVLLAAAWYAKRKATEVAKVVAPYVNPMDERNVVNQAAQSFYQSMTGSTGTIGTDLYDLFNPTNNKGTLNATLPTAPYANGAYQWMNPASDQNLIYRGVNGIGEFFTGSQDWSLGTAIYDWTH